MADHKHFEHKIQGHADHWVYNLEKKSSVKQTTDLHGLKHGQIRIKVDYFAVIPLDVFARNQTHDVVLGSQAFGHVAAVTPEQGRFKVGDRVGVGIFRSACGTCRECDKSRQDLCTRAEFTSSSHFGGYSTHLDIGSHWAYPVPTSIQAQHAPVIISDGVSIYTALRRYVRQGELVAIVGSHAMGQLALQYALALRLDVTIIGEAEDEEAVTKAGGKFIKLSQIGKSKVKFAATLLCVREIDSKLYSDAMGATKNGGKVIIVGHPVQTNIKFGFHMLVTTQLELLQNLTGSRNQTCEALYFSALHNIRPNVALHKFEEVPELFEKVQKDNAKEYIVVKNSA